MNVENPRLRFVLGTQWKVLLVALLVVAVAGLGGAAATYQDQPTTVDTVETNPQTVVTNTTERATVVHADSLWPKGTTLRDKPVYILNATPTLKTTARTRVTGAEAARIRHVWRLTTSVTADGERLYAESRTLANETHRGTTATTTAAIDVERVVRRVANITDKARGAGVVSVRLSLVVVYQTEPGSDGGYSARERYSAPLALGGETYAVTEELGGRREHSTTRQRELTQPRDWGSILGMSLAGLVALALGGAVVAIDPRDIDVEKARTDMHRTRYEEWISPGVIPMGISQQFVELETIEDVVDVAIDTNERVVWDRRRDLYAVISENLVYYFSPSGSWMESAFRSMGGGGSFDGDSPFRSGVPEGPPGSLGGGDGDAFSEPGDGEGPFGDGSDPFGEDGTVGRPPGGEGAGGEPFGGGEDGGPFEGDGDGDPFGDEGDDDPSEDGDDPSGDGDDGA